MGFQDDPDFWLKLKQIEESEKTRRWRWLLSCATIGVIAIVIGVVKIVDKPPWVEIAALLIICLVGPSGVLRSSLKSKKKYVDKTHKRIVELEREHDPNRESSDDTEE